jgi:hypothetical protein
MITEHPDQAKFKEIGSPYNLLARIENGSANSFSLLTHYSNSQESFANLAMQILIDFDLGKVFDQSTTTISAEELANIEKSYKVISDARLKIFCQTKERKRERDLAYAAVDSVMKEDLDSLNEIEEAENYRRNSAGLSIAENVLRLSYRDPEKNYEDILFGTTVTCFSGGDRSQRYGKIGATLRLSEVVKAMQIQEEAIDSSIILGKLLRNKNDGKFYHEMGSYRAVDGNEKIRIKRVDEVTALAAKKALMAQDEDEVLKYAVIFSTLRGYNLRSVSGACFAHEMSFRSILSEKKLPQFYKAPGILLDVEAVSTEFFDENQPQRFENFVAKQVSDYKASISADPLPEGCFFEHPIASRDKDFTRYLMETGRYREEDLIEIAKYNTKVIVKDITGLESEKTIPSFLIMVNLGDERFFKEMIAKIQTDETLSEIMHEISGQYDWEFICDQAGRLNGEEFSELVRSFCSHFTELEVEDAIEVDYSSDDERPEINLPIQHSVFPFAEAQRLAGGDEQRKPNGRSSN